MKKFKDNNKGFSLVELIVVIAIMVVLIAVLGSTILGYIEKAKYSKDISALDSINTAVKTFVADPSSTATDDMYMLDDLIVNHDKGGVILPILAEVFGVVYELLSERKIKNTAVLPIKWKAHFKIAGKGRAQEKKMAQAYVLKNYNIKCTEDEADSLCIALYHFENNNVFDWS